MVDWTVSQQPFQPDTPPFFNSAVHYFRPYLEAKRYNPYGKYSVPMGLALFTSRQHDAALSEFNSIRNPHAMVDALRAASLAHLGNREEAARAVEDFLRKVRSQLEQSSVDIPEYWIALIAQRFPYRQTSDKEHLIEGLRKAGVPE